MILYVETPKSSFQFNSLAESFFFLCFISLSAGKVRMQTWDTTEPLPSARLTLTINRSPWGMGDQQWERRGHSELWLSVNPTLDAQPQLQQGVS